MLGLPRLIARLAPVVRARGVDGWRDPGLWGRGQDPLESQPPSRQAKARLPGPEFAPRCRLVLRWQPPDPSLGAPFSGLRPPVPQALQTRRDLKRQSAAATHLGFSVCADPTGSRRPLQRRFHAVRTCTVRIRKITIPSSSKPQPRLRMTARVSSPTKENRYTAAWKAMLTPNGQGEAPVEPRGEAANRAQPGVLGTGDAGGGADQQRFTNPCRRSTTPTGRRSCSTSPPARRSQ